MNWKNWFDEIDKSKFSKPEEQRYAAFKARLMEELQLMEPKEPRHIPYGFEPANRFEK